MSTIAENIAKVGERIRAAAQASGRDLDHIGLLAVSKTKPAAAVREAYAAGIRDFGENYLQEATGKITQLPDTLCWHYTGHLQSNKARQAAELFDVIETVDSLKLALALDRHARALNRQLSVLIQVNIGRGPDDPAAPCRRSGTEPPLFPHAPRTGRATGRTGPFC